MISALRAAQIRRLSCRQELLRCVAVVRPNHRDRHAGSIVDAGFVVDAFNVTVDVQGVADPDGRVVGELQLAKQNYAGATVSQHPDSLDQRCASRRDLRL
jgi:hypothetical protein